MKPIILIGIITILTSGCSRSQDDGYEFKTVKKTGKAIVEYDDINK